MSNDIFINRTKKGDKGGILSPMFFPFTHLGIYFHLSNLLNLKYELKYRLSTLSIISPMV